MPNIRVLSAWGAIEYAYLHGRYLSLRILSEPAGEVFLISPAEVAGIDQGLFYFTVVTNRNDRKITDPSGFWREVHNEELKRIERGIANGQGAGEENKHPRID